MLLLFRLYLSIQVNGRCDFSVSLIMNALVWLILLDIDVNVSIHSDFKCQF